VWTRDSRYKPGRTSGPGQPVAINWRDQANLRPGSEGVQQEGAAALLQQAAAAWRITTSFCP